VVNFRKIYIVVPPSYCKIGNKEAQKMNLNPFKRSRVKKQEALFLQAIPDLVLAQEDNEQLYGAGATTEAKTEIEGTPGTLRYSSDTTNYHLTKQAIASILRQNGNITVTPPAKYTIDWNDLDKDPMSKNQASLDAEDTLNRQALDTSKAEAERINKHLSALSAPNLSSFLEQNGFSGTVTYARALVSVVMDELAANNGTYELKMNGQQVGNILSTRIGFGKGITNIFRKTDPDTNNNLTAITDQLGEDRTLQKHYKGIKGIEAMVIDATKADANGVKNTLAHYFVTRAQLYQKP
jgi:hypothetical protein